VEARPAEAGSDAAPPPPARSEPVVVCHRYHEAVELVGRRWSGAILFSLIGGPRYFSDVAAAVPGVSDRLLSQRLRELERYRASTDRGNADRIDAYLLNGEIPSGNPRRW
jgi:hypothetical protein